MAVWLTMATAADWIGPRRAGRPTSRNTVTAWCIHGLRGVKLRSVLRGGVRMTRLRWIRQFWRECALARERVA